MKKFEFSKNYSGCGLGFNFHTSLFGHIKHVLLTRKEKYKVGFCYDIIDVTFYLLKWQLRIHFVWYGRSVPIR